MEGRPDNTPFKTSTRLTRKRVVNRYLSSQLVSCLLSGLSEVIVIWSGNNGKVTLINRLAITEFNGNNRSAEC